MVRRGLPRSAEPGSDPYRRLLLSAWSHRPASATPPHSSTPGVEASWLRLACALPGRRGTHCSLWSPHSWALQLLATVLEHG